MDRVSATFTLYPNIGLLVSANDLSKWTLKLHQQADFEDYLFNPDTARLNILNTAAIIGHSHVTNQQTVVSVDAESIFQKINERLALFPTLLTDKSFQQKIKNLSEYSFLSCLSELSLAAKFKNLGFAIGFEIRFPQLSNGNIKDIDLSITDDSGRSLYLEVYMPVHQTTEKGFLDFHGSDWPIVYGRMNEAGRIAPLHAHQLFFAFIKSYFTFL